jgi:hypothetical protein
MTVYTVHLQGEDAETASFVPEGFAWRAFVVPPLWLLWHRLWLAFVLWCVACAIIIAPPLHLPFLAKELLFLLIALLCGLEGQQWRRQKLLRQGKRIADIVSGDTRDDAEFHFFHHWAERRPSMPNEPRYPAQGVLAPLVPTDQTPFGLFPEPEKPL